MYTREEKKRKEKELIEKFEAKQEEAGWNQNQKLVCTVKKLLFGDNQAKILDLKGTRGRKNHANMINAIRFVVEEILELTPEEYDAIYSTQLNKSIRLEHAIREVVKNAPEYIMEEAMFDYQKMIFRMCWPDYFKEHYSGKLTPMEIFDAKGSFKSALIRAARIRAVDEKESDGAKLLNNGKFSSKVVENKRERNHGEQIDKLVFEALRTVMSEVYEAKTEDLFNILAQPHRSKIDQFGCIQVIAARGCYPTPLDFYFLNSDVNYQMKHIHEYMAARSRAHLPHIKALDCMYEAFQRVYEGKVPDKEETEEIDME